MGKSKLPDVLKRACAWIDKQDKVGNGIDEDLLNYLAMEDIPLEYVEFWAITDPAQQVPRMKIDAPGLRDVGVKFPQMAFFSFVYMRWCKRRSWEGMPDFPLVFARFATITECWLELKKAGKPLPGIRPFAFNMQKEMIEELAPAVVECRITDKIMEAMLPEQK